MTDKERIELLENELKLTKIYLKKEIIKLEYKIKKHSEARIKLYKNQNQKVVEALDKVNSILADAIIEITEPLEVLDFQDLEKIARCFENKIDQLIKEYGGE